MKNLRSYLRYAYRFFTLPRKIAELQSQLLTLQSPPTYVGNNLALCKIRNRYGLYVDTRDRGVARCIMLHGFWELEITDLWRSLCKPGQKVLEIGANIGYYTIQTADIIGNEGHIWAFEANPAVCDLLKLNVDSNGFANNVSIVNKAAHRKEGVSNFNVFDFAQGSSTLGDIDPAIFNMPDTPVRKIEVPLIAIDDLITNDIIDLVKMDAEGSEPDVIEGMIKIIERSPNLKIIIEFAPINLQANKHNPESFLRRLEQIGFIIYRINESGKVEKTNTQELLARDWNELFLCKKPFV